MMPVTQSIASDTIEPNESSPLLHHDHDENIPPVSTEVLIPAKLTSGWIPESRRPFFVVVLCTVCVLAIDAGIFMQLVPITRILEGIICHSYYEHHPDLVDFKGPIPEEMCKISPVQGELAMLKGWSGLFDCLPGIGAVLVSCDYPLSSG
jgi:hypothetical protein